MDPYSFNIDSASELRLRRHLREVLLPYARTHLTSDHVAFTEKVVEEILLQTLEYVPMADATSFFLPTDPFEVLMRYLHSLDLSPPEVRWVTHSEHVKYLRTFFPPPTRPQDLPTDKCWLENDNYVKLSLICRPVSSPILSKRARRETPKLGSTHSRPSPLAKSALKAVPHDLDSSLFQDMESLPAPLVDDVLDLRLKLDSATGSRLRPFFQPVSLQSVGEKHWSEDAPNALGFLSHNSPPRCFPDLTSPPLFPRVVQGRSVHKGIGNGAKSGTSNPACVSDMASKLQMASPELMDGEDGDINNHHMEVVTGWTTLTFSSPPPPSANSSDGSEVDELWYISPPGTPATSLMAAKMDEVEIPRIRKFGYKNTLSNERTNDIGVAAPLTAANSSGFSITSFISAPIPMALAHKQITPQPEGVKFGTHTPRPFSPGQSTSNSLLGQPPSERANEQTPSVPAYVDGSEDPQFDDAVASFYVSIPQDPISYIKEEKLDDKDIMLMDVPNLPPPTEHPKDLTLLPEGMQSFVAPKGELAHLDTANQSRNVGAMAFLRAVKGIKPLALDLSWRPFNFGKSIPTDEEAAGIAKPIRPEEELLGYVDEKYKKTARVLLDRVTSPISAEDAQLTLTPKIPRGCEEFGKSPAPRRVEESEHIEYVLTQRERMKVSGIKFTPEEEDIVDAEPDIAPCSHSDGNGDILIEQENLRQQEEHQSPRDLFDTMVYLGRTDNGYSFDDSGIDIMDCSLGQSTSEFGLPFLLRPMQDDPLQAQDTSKENVDYQSENKENIPPGNVDNYNLADYQPDSLETQYDWSNYFEFPEPPFEPLSFASQSQRSGPPDDLTLQKVQDKVPPPTPSAHRVKRPENHLASTTEQERTNSRGNKRRKLDDIAPASSKDLFSTFIGLRNQASLSRTLEHSETRNDAPTLHHHQTLDQEAIDVPEKILPRAIPDDVFDQHTVCLPEHWIPAAAVHRYLASVTLIQKRALVRELQGHHCRVILVERCDLGAADIIIDPDYCVLFTPLLALPAQLESAIERISRESWRYSNLLVILEAFPSAQSYRADRSRDPGPAPYPYTPPICKAIKKLKRNLGIAEGCGTMNPRCTVTWAFANDTEETAKYVRCFGEEACAISKERGHGILWDEREWLEEEPREGESDLAGVHGMNTFAAFLMLYDRSLEAILDLSPEARLANFGHLVGEERMTVLNAVIESRMQQIAPDIVE